MCGCRAWGAAGVVGWCGRARRPSGGSEPHHRGVNHSRRCVRQHTPRCCLCIGCAWCNRWCCAAWCWAARCWWWCGGERGQPASQPHTPPTCRRTPSWCVAWWVWGGVWWWWCRVCCPAVACEVGLSGAGTSTMVRPALLALPASCVIPACCDISVHPLQPAFIETLTPMFKTPKLAMRVGKRSMRRRRLACCPSHGGMVALPPHPMRRVPRLPARLRPLMRHPVRRVVGVEAQPQPPPLTCCLRQRVEWWRQRPGRTGHPPWPLWARVVECKG